MTRPPAKSLAAAEKKALQGENESQDSQAILLKLMEAHGVGLTSSSPVRDEDAAPRKIVNTKATTSEPVRKKKPEGSLTIPVQVSGDVHSLRSQTLQTSKDGTDASCQHPQNASNASDDNDNDKPNRHPPPDVVAASSTTKQLTKPLQHPRSSGPRSSRSSRSSSNWQPEAIVEVPIQPNPYDAFSAVESPSPLIRNDALPQLPPSSAPVKKKAREMSSQSPTQSNDGRSYEQYDNDDDVDGRELQSTQGSNMPEHEDEHRTLHSEDLGFVNLHLPESIPQEPGMAHPDHGAKSQFTSQGPSTDGRYNTAPETPAIAQRFFGQSGNDLIAPSQMFGQTQGTPGFKKLGSPTSSRPSTDVFKHNTLSPNPVISSPLKNRDLRTSPTQGFESSPLAFPAQLSRPSDEKTTSPPTQNHEDEDQDQNQRDASQPTLPPFQSRRSRTAREPIAQYHPHRKRSPGSEVAKSSSPRNEDEDSDFEDDNSLQRRRVAESMRQKGLKGFQPIGLPPSNSNKDIEVPSTNRTKATQNRERTIQEQYVAQCNGKNDTDNDGSQETVADSQDAILPQKSIEGPEELLGSLGGANERTGHGDNNPTSNTPMDNGAYKETIQETIPETSPVGTAGEPPRLVGDLLRQTSSAASRGETVSLPTLSSGPLHEQREESDVPVHSSLPEQGVQGRSISGREQKSGREEIVRSSPPIVLASSSQQSSARRSSRLKVMSTPAPTVPGMLIPSDPGTRTSTLTALSSTPIISSSTTPNTENDGGAEDNGPHASSPAADKGHRRGTPSSLAQPSPSLPKKNLKTYSRSRDSIRREARQQSRRSSISMSTDELAKSLSPVSSKEDRKTLPRKAVRQSAVNQHLTRETTSKSGIFEGMVFAISFQERPTQKGRDKQMDKTAVERMIRQEGGRILADGFSELFRFDSLQTAANAPSTPVLSSSLKLLDHETGFTALIADSHSRKVKYMQALALDIPCLAPKWVATCVAKKEVVDWSSYLLCAGPSALLGDAIRSRNLQPYDASTARLVNVINKRPKLLEDGQILLVMKKTKNEGKRWPYVFLAQVLGASLVRVHSLGEARAKLHEKEAQNEEFDWVYVDDHLHDVQAALFGQGTGDAASKRRTTSPKKRKRPSTESSESDRPPKRIRTLNDELVIQSLILGRLIEDGEMEE